MVRNSTEQLGGEYDLESKESAFPAHQQGLTQLSRAFTNVIMMLAVKGVVFFIVLL